MSIVQISAHDLVRTLARGTAAVAVTGALIVGSGAAMAEDKRVKLKMPTAFPTAWPIVGSTAKYFVKTLKAVTGGTVTARVYEPGKLVPSFEIHKAVSDGKIEAGYTCSAYLGGSLKESIPFCTFPFSPQPLVFATWLYEGNGLKLWQKMYDDAGYKVKVLPLSIYGSEGAGWFTKRVQTLEDYDGVKIRIGGFAAPTLKKLGAVPTLIPFAEIFPGLEKGVIDAAEVGLPSNDLKGGFHKVAKFYSMPSWHQPTTVLELIINMDVWNGMSDTQRAQVEAVAYQTNMWSMTHANATQAGALRELRKKGVEVVSLDEAVVDQLRVHFKEVIAEEIAKHPNLKAVWEDLKAFMKDYQEWEDTGMLRRDQDVFD